MDTRNNVLQVKRLWGQQTMNQKVDNNAREALLVLDASVGLGSDVAKVRSTLFSVSMRGIIMNSEVG